MMWPPNSSDQRSDPAWYLLVAYYFAAPWMYIVVLPLPLSQMLGGLLIVICLLLLAFRGRFHLPDFHLWLGVFCLWCALTGFWAANPDLSWDGIAALLKCYLVVFATWQICGDRKEYEVLVRVFIAGCAVAIVYSMAEYLGRLMATGDVYEIGRRWRFAGGFYDSNWFSVVTAASFPLAVLAGKSARSAKVKYLWFSFLLVGWYAILLSASRTGLACAVVSTTALLLIEFPRHKGTVIFFGLTVGGLFGGGLLEVPGASANRLASSLEELQTGTLSGRTEIWAASLRLIADNYLLGVGWFSFSTALYPYLGRAFAAHNSILSVAGETGMFGLLSLGLAFWALLRQAWAQHLRQYSTPLISLVTLFLGLQTLSIGTQHMLWSLIALLAGLVYSAVGKSAADKQSGTRNPIGKMESAAARGQQDA